MSRIRLIMVAMLAVFAVGAVASASALAASEDIWEVCKEGGTEKFETNACAKTSSTGKFSFKKLETGETVKTVSSGSKFVLNKGKTTEIECTAVSDKGTITGGKPGTDEATEIKFTGCTTPKEKTCKVKSKSPPPTRAGTIVVSKIPTKLEQRKNAKGEEVVVDNFEQKLVGTTKEFVTLEFGTEEVEEPAGSGEFVLKKTCKDFPPTTKVKGTVGAEVVKGTGELNFPEPELEKDTLEAFGTAAVLTGKDTMEQEGGGAIRAK